MAAPQSTRNSRKKRKDPEVPIVAGAPLVDATCFDGAYELRVPRGWLTPAEVRATAFGTCRVAAMLATFFAPPLARTAERDPAAFVAFALMAAVVAACALVLRRAGSPSN